MFTTFALAQPLSLLSPKHRLRRVELIEFPASHADLVDVLDERGLVFSEVLLNCGLFFGPRRAFDCSHFYG